MSTTMRDNLWQAIDSLTSHYDVSTWDAVMSLRMRTTAREPYIERYGMGLVDAAEQWLTEYEIAGAEPARPEKTESASVATASAPVAQPAPRSGNAAPQPVGGPVCVTPTTVPAVPQWVETLAGIAEQLNGSSLADAAVAYAELGFTVVPCNWVNPDGSCSCRAGLGCGSAGKHPHGLLAPNGSLAGSADPRNVAAWWRSHPALNIGLACGIQFDAIDVDDKNGTRPGWKNAETLNTLGHLKGVWAHASTPTGGGHLLTAPTGVKGAATAFAIDTRGKSNIVIASPSSTAAGRYQWVKFAPARYGSGAITAAQIRAVFESPRPPRTPYSGPKGDVKGLVAYVKDSQEGFRNDRLFWAACAALEGGNDPERLREAGLSIGLEDAEIDSVFSSACRTVGGQR